jgi:hypothetical protein
MKAELALSRIEISRSTAEQILDEFCTICEQVWMDHELYVSLCEADQDTMDLCNSIAPMFFADLTRILIEHQFLQFSKVTDPARTGKIQSHDELYPQGTDLASRNPARTSDNE